MAISDLQDFAGPRRKDERIAWPGGFGAVTRRLAEILEKRPERLLTDCTVVAVSNEPRAVYVTCMRGGRLETITARAAIMATPAFINARLIVGLPQAQLQAMRAIRYAPYLVVNLIYNSPVFDQGYDTWCPGQTFSDVIVADWMLRKQPGYTPRHAILTCYTPLREADRSRLASDAATIEIAQQVVRDVQKTVPNAQIDPIEVHVYRRGHPIFMATPGTFTQILPSVRKPHGRVFFAHTDSQGPVSSVEGALHAAERAVAEAARTR